jgi:Predicted amino acid aldolase or racemase
MMYHINNIDELDSPALVFYPALIKENIDAAINMVDDIQRLRPHVKTNKSADITKLMLAAGIQKFKCATIAEAEMLALCGAGDVLLAYQPVGPKLQRLVQLTQRYPDTRFSCLIDNAASATAIAKTFAQAGSTIATYIDLNVGQNRTGIAPGEKAVQLYNYCAQLSGLMMTGLHAYDGHIRNQNLAARTAAVEAAFAPVAAMRNQLQSMGYHDIIIIAGGTPSFPVHAPGKEVECSPGTFVLWDQGYTRLCPEQPFKAAALLVTRVVSLPADHLICVDLGHKSVSAENDISQRVFFPDAPALKPVGQSEEHLVLDAGAGHSFKVGDVFYGVPVHVCPTVALYDRAVIVEERKVTGEWEITSRKRKITI